MFSRLISNKAFNAISSIKPWHVGATAFGVGAATIRRSASANSSRRRQSEAKSKRLLGQVSDQQMKGLQGYEFQYGRTGTHAGTVGILKKDPWLITPKDQSLIQSGYFNR